MILHYYSNISTVQLFFFSYHFCWKLTQHIAAPMAASSIGASINTSKSVLWLYLVAKNAVGCIKEKLLKKNTKRRAVDTCRV
jgi:hypothetical protein